MARGVKNTAEIAKLSGQAKKNPKRHKANTAPKSEFGIGSPPDRMMPAAKKVWVELVKYAPAGILGGSDRMHLEIICDLMAEYLDPPSYGFTTSKYNILLKGLSDLGLNPAARQKLGVVKPEKPKDDDFSEF